MKKFSLKQNAFLFFPLGAALLLRIFHAWNYYGFKYMDEHWQVLEPANFLVHRVWSQTVEWRDGLRCWIYPWIISWGIRAAEAFGFTNPIFINSFIKSIYTVWSLFGIYLACKLAAKLYEGYDHKKSLMLVNGWFLALLPYSVYCGVHYHGDMFAAVLIVWAYLQILLNRNIGAGFFFGLATAVKVDLGVAGFVTGIWYLLTRQFKKGFQLLLGAIPGAFLLGLVDKLTWGKWFQNALGHAHVNLVEEIGNQWGTSPWYMHLIYFLSMTSICGGVALALLPHYWKKLNPNTKTLWVTTLGFIAVFSYVAHKEKRFMAPLLYVGFPLSLQICYFAWAEFKKHKRTMLAVHWILGFAALVHVGSDINAYYLIRPWHERVLALTQAAQAPGVQKMFSPQWPAVFYFPRNIPVYQGEATQEAIRKETVGYNVISVAHDGKHMKWWEDIGFKCQPSPTPPRESKDPVPTAWLCQR